MMSSPRYLHCIFADDIRLEASGKQLVVGMYQGGMNVVGPLPMSLPQLNVMALLHLPMGEPLTSLKVNVSWNETTLTEMELPQEMLTAPGNAPPDAQGFIVQLVIGLAPFVVDGNGKLKVQATIDGDQVMVGNMLHVTHMPIETT